jgi:hypothetical protein
MRRVFEDATVRLLGANFCRDGEHVEERSKLQVGERTPEPGVKVADASEPQAARSQSFERRVSAVCDAPRLRLCVVTEESFEQLWRVAACCVSDHVSPELARVAAIAQLARLQRHREGTEKALLDGV